MGHLCGRGHPRLRGQRKHHPHRHRLGLGLDHHRSRCSRDQTARCMKSSVEHGAVKQRKGGKASKSAIGGQCKERVNRPAQSMSFLSAKWDEARAYLVVATIIPRTKLVRHSRSSRHRARACQRFQDACLLCLLSGWCWATQRRSRGLARSSSHTDFLLVCHCDTGTCRLLQLYL